MKTSKGLRSPPHPPISTWWGGGTTTGMSGNVAAVQLLLHYHNLKKILMLIVGVFQVVPGLYHVFWLAVTDVLHLVCSHSLTGSVDDIIDHYKKEQIVEGYNLKDPVSVQVSTNVYWHYWACLMWYFRLNWILFDLMFFKRFTDCFCTYCSTRNKFLLTQWMAEKFITLSDGKQKMLSTKTLSRKATSCSTKVCVKSVLYSYLKTFSSTFKSLCFLVVRIYDE